MDNNRLQSLDPLQERELDTVQLVKELIGDAEHVYGSQWEAIDEDLAFALELDHYESPKDRSRERNRIQPKTLELFHHLRHKWSEISSAESYVECLPIDDMGDAETAEWAKFAIQHEIHNPVKRYKARRRTMVIGGLAARMWGMKLDYCDGQIYFCNVDPCNFAIAPGWTDMHDPTCPWVYEVGEYRVQDVLKWGEEAGWSNLDKVKGGLVNTATRGGTRGHDSRGRTYLNRTEDQPKESGGNKVKMAFVHFRFSDETYSKNKFMELPPEEQFYECEACGYEYPREEIEGNGPPQMESVESMSPESEPNPEGAPEMMGEEQQYPCPECGAPMQLNDVVEEQQVYDTYPNGRYVVVDLTDEAVLFDGPWRFRWRSFPYWFFRGYEHPRQWIHLSDTALNWTLQVMSNAVLRKGFEQLIHNVDVIMTPMGGLLNSKREPFIFTDQAGQIAYFADPVAAQMTKHFQGSGLPPAWGQLNMTIENKFRANVGTADIGVAPPQSKDIPVGTVEAMVRQGNIPNEDHISVLREDEGIFLGCLLDMIIGGAWGVEKWVRMLGPKGIYVMQKLAGSDIPQMDVFVSGAPKLSAIKQQEFQIFMQWVQLGQVDPAAQLVGAELLNISPSMIQKYVMARQQLMGTGGGPGKPGDANQPPSGNGGAPNGVPGPVADRMGSMNGG